MQTRICFRPSAFCWCGIKSTHLQNELKYHTEHRMKLFRGLMHQTNVHPSEWTCKRSRILCMHLKSSPSHSRFSWNKVLQESTDQNVKEIPSNVTHPYKQIANSLFLNLLRWSSHVRSSSPFWMPAVYFSSKQTSATLITYFLSDNRESCSSREQSTWQDERQEAGMRMRPRHRCSMGEGKERWVLRYSTASWRMTFPCLSMQWNAPTKKRPSLTPTNIRRNSIFRTWLTNGELFGSELTGIVGGLDWCGLWCWGTKEDSADTSMSIELKCPPPVQRTRVGKMLGDIKPKMQFLKWLKSMATTAWIGLLLLWEEYMGRVHCPFFTAEKQRNTSPN